MKGVQAESQTDVPPLSWPLGRRLELEGNAWKWNCFYLYFIKKKQNRRCSPSSPFPGSGRRER